MPYLGNNPTVGNFVKLDTISTVNGQATYNLTLDSTAFTPESANHMLVVVNGIVQSPTTNYTVSGSQITFTGNLVTGDVVNEIRVFGDVLNIGTPSDATVTNAKTNFVSTSSAAGLSIKGDGTTDGTVQLNCSQNSHGVKIASPAHSAGQSYTIKLPTENIAADKIMKVASISGSGATAIGQMSFVDEPSGGMTLLNSTSISSGTSAVDFNSSLITSTYKLYVFHVIGLFDSVTSGSNGIGMRFSADNGSSVSSSGYRTHNRRYNEGGYTDYSINGSTISEMRITEMVGVYHGMSTGEGIDMTIEVYDPLASRQTRMNYRGVSIADRNTGYGDESITHWIGASCEAEPSAVNFIRFLPRSGTFESGTIKLYGIKA
jgi:hypothetical protein